MACLTCFFTTVFAILTGLLVILKLYVKLKLTWCTSKRCLIGKTIIVTGANTGIGYESALEFAKRGARVILACRNDARASAARDKIVRETGNKNVIIKLVDFSSLKSVRSFAKDIVETEERIDVLVNNAGIGEAADKRTEDGLPFVMQVNHFGPFLLTLLLIDKLKNSAPSRIVNVSSIMAAYSKLDVDNLNSDAESFRPYSNSKVCNILFTIHLAKLLERHNITVYSVHPGTVDTEFSRDSQGLRKIIIAAIKPFMKTSEEGAQTVIYTAIQQGIEYLSGRHFDECKAVKPYATARDPELPEKVWDNSVELLKCQEEAQNV